MFINYFKNYILLIFSIALLTSCTDNKTETLTIATAANMQFAIQEITIAFTQETGIKCETIVSSSGKLTAQIKEGAPYDIFISADMKFPTELYKTGFSTSEPKIYAYGKLVMWTLYDSIQPSFELLTSEKIKHIAVANPKTAPYGIAAKEVLLKKGLLSKIEDKLVFGESVAQTNQFITTKAAEIGLTAMSIVLSPKMKEKGNWIAIDKSDYTPISQGIVILKNNPSNISNANLFYNFLLSPSGSKILTKFGYSILD